MSELFRDEIANFTLKIAKPLYWHDRRLGWPKPVQGASCFILRFERGLVGITADHVLQVYEDARESNPLMVCQLGLLRLNLHERIIDRDRELDIATFSVSDAELEGIPGVAIDCSRTWPAPAPKHLQAISLAGFPEGIREVNADSSAVFAAYGALAAVEDFSKREILVTFDPNRDQGMVNAPIRSPPGFNMPPLGFNMSGCSGGPALTHGVRNGLHRWFLSGMIIGGSGEASTGEALNFDTIRLRRTHFIREDGTLIRPSTGWLP